MATRVSRSERDLIEALASARETTVSKILGELAISGARKQYRKMLQENDEGSEVYD
jgi:hypothetical protein